MQSERIDKDLNKRYNIISDNGGHEMKLTTRIFGEIEIDDSKIIEFPKGIIGFPDMTRFTLIHDADRESSTIRWLQSIDEPTFALPVLDPLLVKPGYSIPIDRTEISDMFPLDEEDLLILVTVTVPSDLKKMTVNLKGPIIINSEVCKAAQVIIDDEEYLVKYPIYDYLQEQRKAATK